MVDANPFIVVNRCLSPPPLCRGNLYFCFAKIVRMIVGEYEQRAVYKCYHVVGNGSDIVLETSGAIYRVN